MNAVEFVRKFGWEESQHISSLIMETGENIYGVEREDLHRLVESYELVVEFGDNETYLKNYLTKNPKVKGFYLESWCKNFSRGRLEQAIADVEKCQ